MRALPAYVNLREICASLGLSRSTVYRYIERGQFPPPKKFGRVSRWRLEDVQAALDALPEDVTPDRTMMQRRG